MKRQRKFVTEMGKILSENKKKKKKSTKRKLLGEKEKKVALERKREIY